MTKRKYYFVRGESNPSRLFVEVFLENDKKIVFEIKKQQLPDGAIDLSFEPVAGSNEALKFYGKDAPDRLAKIAREIGEKYREELLKDENIL